MAKKKTTRKKTVEKVAPKSGVNKAEEIRKALAAAPEKTTREISEMLTAKGIAVSPAHVSTVKSNLKAKAKKKKVAAKKKVARKKHTPQATPSEEITFEQLRMVKELAQQLGGTQKAQEALAALADLVS